VSRSGLLKIGVIAETPRFNEVNNGRRGGFEVEVLRQVASTMGLKVVWVPVQADDLVTDLENGQVDFVAWPRAQSLVLTGGLTVTDPYYCSGGVMLSRNGEVRTSRDLGAKRIAVQLGKKYLEYVKRLSLEGSANMSANAQAAILSLIYNNSDVAIVDKFSALQAIATYPKANLRSGYLLWNDRVGLIAESRNINLKVAFNKALAETIAKSAYGKLSSSYFAENIRCREY
jgi:polar amino acid transport system substrate-binding protein